MGLTPSAVRRAKLGHGPRRTDLRSLDRYVRQTPAQECSLRRQSWTGQCSTTSPRQGDRKPPCEICPSRKSLAPRRIVRDFHSSLPASRPPFSANSFQAAPNSAIWHGVCEKWIRRTAPNPVTRLWTALHSIENTCTYKRVFLIDGKNRRSTTGSFFDSFLSFSGWCGVRGSSGVTVLIARLERRVSKGL